MIKSREITVMKIFCALDESMIMTHVADKVRTSHERAKDILNEYKSKGFMEAEDKGDRTYFSRTEIGDYIASKCEVFLEFLKPS